MKLCLELQTEMKREKLILFQKLVAQLRKIYLSNQKVYITFDTQNMKFITQNQDVNSACILSLIDIGLSYFCDNINIESQQQRNLIMLKLKDFIPFANKVSSISESATKIQMNLYKDQDERYFRIQVTEEESVVTSYRAEIDLHFEHISFGGFQDQLFSMTIKTKDLNKLLEISIKKQTPISMRFTIYPDKYGMIEFYIGQLSSTMKIIYNQVPLDQVAIVSDESRFFQFTINEQLSKQLNQVCMLDEEMQISILKQKSLCLEFSESNENSIIIALKTFIVPYIINADDQDEGEVEIKEESNNAE